MLYEIYFFLFVTILLVILLSYRFINVLFIPFLTIFSYFKKEYTKFFSLNSIKKQILDQDEEKEKLVEVLSKNVDLNLKAKQEKNKQELRQKSKINKLFLKVEVAKQKGEIEEIERLLIEILSIDEDNIKALEILSNLYINLGKDKKAFSLLKKLIQLDMENDNAIWNLSKLYLDLGEIDTSYILIQKAISINGHNHRYYVTYADILYNKGELDEAVKAIESVLEIKPKNVIYLDALASLYEEKGDFAKARSYWLGILDLEPDYERAKEKIKTI